MEALRTAAEVETAATEAVAKLNSTPPAPFYTSNPFLISVLLFILSIPVFLYLRKCRLRRQRRFDGDDFNHSDPSDIVTNLEDKVGI